jgi:HEPN domain-containing protein
MSDPDDSATWARLSRRDYASARVLLEIEHLHNAAYLTQQAAEKALKASLLRARVLPPRIHDLTELFARLPEPREPMLSPELLYEVTMWCVSARYSDDELPGPGFQRIAQVLDLVDVYLTRQGW